MAGKITSGKQANQKLKPLLVYQYLCRNTDINHAVSASEIVAYLKEFGIEAERRSIYTDIEQINKVMLISDDDMTLQEAEETLEDGYDEDKTVIYDKSRKGFYVNHRTYDLDAIRLLAESVYSARFVDDAQMEQLIDVICSLVSDYQAEKIDHSVINVDHFRTSNKDTFFNVGIINDAMSTKLEGVPHTPEKISFAYLRYSISDMKQSVVRRGGEEVIVSPYKLIISDGNYYLRCFDDRHQRMQTYRVDRMKNVKLLGLPRDGEEVATAEDYKTYTQRVFSMFGGEKEHVRLKFSMSLLDTVIEKFGKDKLKYHKIDDHHFSVLTEVEISPQFFSWICGLGTSVEILDPPEVREDYTKYLQSIIKKYK